MVGSPWSAARPVEAVLGLVVGSVLISSCATTVPGSGVAAPGEVAAYRSEVGASREAAVREAGVDLCREGMAAMVVMVRGYNTFLTRLNITDSYAQLGDLDEKARASLIAGSDQIRRHLNDLTPADVGDPARAFLATSNRLQDAIARERFTGLNPIADQWTGDKQRLLDACVPYVPMPAATSATPRPQIPSSTPTPTG